MTKQYMLDLTSEYHDGVIDSLRGLAYEYFEEDDMYYEELEDQVDNVCEIADTCAQAIIAEVLAKNEVTYKEDYFQENVFYFDSLLTYFTSEEVNEAAANGTLATELNVAISGGEADPLGLLKEVLSMDESVKIVVIALLNKVIKLYLATIDVEEDDVLTIIQKYFN